LHKVALGDAQEAAMDQICTIAADEQVDVVVVSGDVFDHAIPSAESLELLERTLARLVGIAPTVVTAGNHDSLRRLGYGASLMAQRLHLRTRPEEVATPVVVADARIYAIPYLHPDTARYALSPEEPLPATHGAVLTAAMDRVRADLAGHPDATSIVLAHAWVTGGATSDSERDVSVGGLGTVPAAVFEGVDYVALGHLHGPQDVAGPGGTRLRYSGSPLRYSFSEAEQSKSVSIVDLGPAGVERIRAVDIHQPRPMRTLRGLLAELLDPDVHGAAVDAWVSAVVTDDRRPSQMWQRLQQVYPHLLQVRHEPAGGLRERSADRPRGEQKPLEVAADFVEYVTNGPIDAAESEAFDAAVQAVRGGGPE
jgi:exonuclease SbcD